MKVLLLVALVLVSTYASDEAAVATQSVDEDAKKDKPAAGEKDKAKKSIFFAADANGDKKVTLEELKAVLGKVVLMILTINFLKYSTKFQYDTALSLLYLGAGIALVSLALRLTRGHDIDKTKAEKAAGEAA